MKIRNLRWTVRTENEVTTQYRNTLVTLTEVSSNLGLNEKLWHISIDNEPPCDAANNLKEAKRLARRCLTNVYSQLLDKSTAKGDAYQLLAKFVEEAIVDAQCDLTIFLGVEGNKPSPYWGKKLATALTVLGYNDAAERVNNAIK